MDKKHGVPKIVEALGPSPTIAMLLYLRDNEPAGVEKFREANVASYSAIYRVFYVLETQGLIVRDKSRMIPGKPYILTPLGRKVADKLVEIEELL